MLVLMMLAAYANLGQVLKDLARANWRWVLLAFGAHYSTYFFRGWRWHKCLRHTACPASRRQLAMLVIFYQFVDNIVPAKLGDLYGAHLAKINYGLRRSTALGSMVFLRIMDLWFVLPLAVLSTRGLFSDPKLESLRWGLAGGTAAAVVLSIALLVLLLLHRNPPHWIPEGVHRRLEAFGTGLWPNPGELLGIAGLTGVIWGLEVTRMYCAALALGIHLTPLSTIFLTMVPLAATALPWPPSGAGAAEIGLLLALQTVGVSRDLGMAITILDRLAAYWSHIGLGVLMWTMRGWLGLRTWRQADMLPPLDEDEEQESKLI